MTTVVLHRADAAIDHAAIDHAAADPPFIVTESLGYLANALAKAFARALGDALQPHGVSVARWAVLLVLWAEDGPSQTVLSRRVAIEDATMVRTLDGMERDGLVARRRDTRDRRVVHVHLTPRGWELRDTLVPAAQAVQARAGQTLSAAEQAQARDLFTRMLTALAAPAAAPPGTE